MASFESCLTSLSLGDKVSAAELKAVAAQYEAEGMGKPDALLRAAEDQLQLAEMEEAGILKAVKEAFEAKGGKVKRAPKAKPEPAPLDHGELNIPGRTKNIDKELDKYKAEQAKEAKSEAKSASAQKKLDKARARELFDEVADDIVAKNGARFGVKELRNELDQMVKWEPAKFIKLAEKFKSEQAAEPAPEPAVQPETAQAEPKSGAAENSPAPTKASITESAAFKKWFGESKAVDAEGKPLVLYHGTNADVTEMRSKGEQNPGLPWTRGIYFTSNPEYAASYADSEGGNVMPVYLSMQNPKIITEGGFKSASISAEQVEQLRAEGFDGIVNKADDEYVVFAPEQAKSATGNNGQFDPEQADLRASIPSNQRTIEVDGVRRPIVDSNDELLAEKFADQQDFWHWYGNGEVDERGRPVVVDGKFTNERGFTREVGERATTNSAASPMDKQVADMVRAGTTVDKALDLIAAQSENPDFRELAKALQAQNLKTGLLLERAKGTYAGGVNPAMATAAYSASKDIAYLHQVEGGEQNLLHELTHAATLKALQKGGLAATQIKALHRYVKGLPNFAGEYGITNDEEFVAEAFTSPRFRQMLADTPAPGTNLSLWQKFVGIVRMLLGKPPVADNVLARVMAAGPDLMAENQQADAVEDMPLAASTSGGLAQQIAGAANNIAGVRLPANYLVGDLFSQTGKLSWWHKTIGTMDNLARRAPAFKPVYDAVQSFIGDVSRYAVSAADLAPTLLPKLENVADIVGAKRKQAVTAADTKAIGAPIFEGTLIWARDANGKPVKVADLESAAEALTTKQKADILIQKGVIDDQQNQAWLGNPLDFYEGLIAKKYAESQLKAGVVWTDAELRSMFSLNKEQVKLYHEFRNAINNSLSNLTISEMVKMGGKDAKGMLDKAIATGSLDKAALMLRDHFRDLAAADPDKADMHLDTATQIMNLADKGQDLIDRGYAPLSRFGKYTVYVEKAGEQVYFGMFESKAEGSMMARKMTLDNPGATVMHGTVSEEAYKLFAGVSPETIELFGSMVGLDSTADAASTEVYQAYLKLAKNNRSAMKRMIQRKGIAGFSEDAGRVLAGFIYSNARLTSGNAHLGDIDEAAQKIPKQEGELMDAAMQLREHIRNPQQGTALGGLMFAQFLGGSVASAMVNLTQPFTMTFPFLSQYGGAGKSATRLGQAIKLAAKDTTGDAQLDAALKWAADEGIVAPQEIHYLQNQAQGKAALQAGDGTKAGDARAALNNTMAKVSLGWGKLFAMAELSNRRITFIAAYKTAVEEGIANPAKFAQEAVSQTQGTYNSGNKPKWARNPIGGLLLTFKQYSVAYLELLTRMAFAGKPGSAERKAGQKAALLMLAVLFVMGGADGLPFEQDLEDAIDALMQRLGYNFSTKRSKQAFLTGVLGEGGADFALKGVSSLPGMPIDVAGRFGMGNLIPGTGLLTKKDSYTRDLGELAGPAGDLAKRAFTGTGKILGGDIAGGVMEMSPAAVRNAAKGADMLATGSYQDARGYKVNDTTPLEGVMKAIGFQPNSTADVQDQKGQALNMIGQARMRSMEIAEHWAQGVANQDAAKIQQARDQLHDWNAKNPETPVKVNMPGILKRVKAMKQDAINRTQKTAPKALKEAVRAELGDTRE